MLLWILLKLQINSKNKCICLINNLEGYNKKDFDIQTQINHEQKLFQGHSHKASLISNANQGQIFFTTIKQAHIDNL